MLDKHIDRMIFPEIKKGSLFPWEFTKQLEENK